MTAPPIDFGQLDGHQRVALMFSGGKDSLALVHLFKAYWERLTVVHLDAGDLLPEVRDLVAGVEAMVPTFSRITTNAPAWIEANRLLPSDLVPTERHPALRLAGDEGPFIIPAFDCCLQNRWKPWKDFLTAKGFTLAIHGQRRSDPVPAAVWIQQEAGPHFWGPIEAWSDADVFAYLKEIGAPVMPFYAHRSHAPECATCPASWSEGRAQYLKQHHPDLAARYGRHLAAHAEAMRSTIRSFVAESEMLEGL